MSSYHDDDDPPPRWLVPSGSLAGWSGRALPDPIAPAEDRRTPGQKRRAKRDAIILVAAAAGFSQRFIAEALGLPRSRVGEIVARTRRRIGARDAG